MPTMPDWARGGRIVADTEYQLAYIKWERRGSWAAYFVPASRTSYVYAEVSNRSLDGARKRVLELVGDSITEMIRACDPRAAFTHWAHVADWRDRACGAPAHLKGDKDPRKATCPQCLAIVSLDVEARGRELGVELPAAKNVVIGFRTANKLAKLVDGFTVTETEI